MPWRVRQLREVSNEDADLTVAGGRGPGALRNLASALSPAATDGAPSPTPASPRAA